jgi:hypothetical protein
VEKKLKKEEEILCGSKIFSITWHGETLMSIFFFNFNFNASLQTTSWALLIEEFKTNHTQQGSCVLLELQKMLVRLYVLCLGLSPDQAPADFYLRTGLKSIKFTGNNLCLSFISQVFSFLLFFPSGSSRKLF